MLIKNEESAWQKASASLDATAKIYGYRVDSVHSETFKFLGGLNRNKKVKCFDFKCAHLYIVYIFLMNITLKDSTKFK